MPIYEYRCRKCSHCFEQIHGAAEKDLKIDCPKCGAPKAERLLSTFSCAGSKGEETGAVSSGCGSGGGRFS